jgi:hypothetical protein
VPEVWFGDLFDDCPGQADNLSGSRKGWRPYSIAARNVLNAVASISPS